jgi:myo-inositol-1-phosphate synthase
MTDERTGLWLVGARGSVATTVATGLALITAGGAGPDGLVTEQPDLAGAGLVPLGHLVVGGHDVAEVPLVKRAAQLADAGVIPHTALTLVSDELDRTCQRIRHGYRDGEERQADAVERLAGDIRAFAVSESLSRVVVVNVSSTEPVVVDAAAHASLGALENAWAAGESPLPASSVYAAAAFTAGAAFVDFTPSTGARLPALEQLAERHGVPWGGSDGKTGETLVKSVLAPMFAARALRVRSWAGTNLLGGGDGATLADPEAMESKARSKARGLEAMLGHPVDGPVHIDNIADLGDWKTAWDHLTFSGFLGTRMSMQFTWQGCDSSLAAPLVIDLARLLDLALRRGEVGPVPALGFFFKDPVRSDEHRLFEQHRALAEWATA